MKRKLLFFCSRLGGGGAEMHLVRVMNQLPQDQFEVHLALTRSGGGYEPLLAEGIQVHYLGNHPTSSLRALLGSIVPLARLVRDLAPEYVISVMDIQNVVACWIKTWWKRSFRAKLVLCCQVAPSKDLRSHRIGKFVARLIPSSYAKADGVIAISKGVKDDLQQNFGIRTPIQVVYNAGLDASIAEKKNEPLELPKAAHQLVAVGRLAPQKGFDTLLEALAKVNDSLDFHCTIIGEGGERANLEQQAQELGLTDRVSFPGFQSNPYTYYAHADAFLLSSRWEGFGNVIVEAMACETPVIATRCDFGPEEIITDGENGLLVPVEDSGALAAAIERLLPDTELQQKLVAGGRKRSEDFSDEKISKDYQETILTF